ncbi:hypothetical protein ATCC90586_011206 [Pythium insidiosum]|nr:hypothetical protein ATCC90586_011206 [Pythium insidiosum]
MAEQTRADVPEGTKGDMFERVMKMLERIDTRVTEIEARSSSSSSHFNSAPQSPALPARPSPAMPPVTTIEHAPSEFGMRLTLNELGESKFAVKSVFKERAGQAAGQIHAPQQPAPTGMIKIPKLMINKFSGVEQYVGLGSGFKQWGFTFLEAIEMAELQSQFTWSERLKVHKLGEYMEPMSVAATYYQANVWVWWAENPTLYHALDQMYQAFKVTITHQQAAACFASEKDKSRSWNQHLLYLIALCRESGSHERLVVENIVKYAAPHMKIALMVRYQPHRTDYLTHAQELVAWAQEIEDDTKAANKMGRDTVNAVGEATTDARKCFNCGNRGHIARLCPYPKKEGRRASFALSVYESKHVEENEIVYQVADDDPDAWVIDSGASRHLIRDPHLLHDVEQCGDADGLLLPEYIVLIRQMHP